MAQGFECDKYGQQQGGNTYDPPNGWSPDSLYLLGKPKADFFGDVIPRFALPPPPSIHVARAEIDDLRELKRTLRAQLDSRIQDENHRFTQVFESVLGISALPAASKYHTSYLANAVISAANFWVTRHKKSFNRMRPVQLAADLDPPFCPGHASYPSGHGSAAHAVASALIDAADRYPGLHAPIRSAAQAIAFHREVAGVHYRSDSDCGEQLARQLVDALRNDPDRRYFDVVAAARAELAGLLGPTPP